MATHDPISLDPNFRDFIESMNCEGVEYLLLGGYAVNFYGHHRFTADIDFWIPTSHANAERVLRALRRFGFSLDAVSASTFTEPNKVHMFGRTPVRIDLLTGPSGVEFSSCFARRRVEQIDGVSVNIIALEDLRINKLASGRDKDLIDLNRLPTSDSR